MKPLIRFTLGPVKSWGLRILRKSLNNLKELYKECDFIVCYNQIDRNKLSFLEGVELYDQNDFKKSDNKPKLEAWKLYPPRLRLNAHELVIDNDLLIQGRVPEIDRFLKEHNTLLLQGTGIKRYYGKYDPLIPEGYVINSGIYGMPPDFDFASLVKQFQFGEWMQDRENGLFDDQGIIAASLLNKDTIIIPKTSIFNCPKITKTTIPIVKGYHFIGANRGEHWAWNEYCISGFRKIYL